MESCRVKDCPRTLTYYAGGGQWMCWFHLMLIDIDVALMVMQRAKKDARVKAR